MGGGLPEPALLPFEEILAAARVAWESHRPAPLEYGSTVGDPAGLKEQVAQYLTRRRGHYVTPGEIFVTTGNQGGIEAISKAFLDPSSVALIESPLWTAAINIVYGSSGAECTMVGHDDEGISAAEVERQIQLAARKGKAVKLIYLQPLHHNPSGVSISRARAEALLRLAAQHMILLVADEPYEAYEYCNDDGESSVERCHLSTMSGGHGVLTVHSFSKTLGTGLRLGYVHSAPALLAPLQESLLTQSSVLLEYTVAELMRSGSFESIAAAARLNYGRKLRLCK
jgi:2-aminoadipate transaminase